MCTLLHFKASGHTCGCSGPIAALSIFINPWFLVGYVLLTPIIWSSIRLKRHTALQLLAGCVIRAGYADLPGAIPVNRESQRTGSTSVRADFYATAKSTHREDPHHAVYVKL